MIPIASPADFAEALGLLRRLAGMTLTAVGAELGTTAQRIIDYEHDRKRQSVRLAIRHLHAIGYGLAIVPLGPDDQTREDS